jgi:hypothetical protein
MMHFGQARRAEQGAVVLILVGILCMVQHLPWFWWRMVSWCC